MESENKLPAEDKPADKKPVEKNTEETAAPKKGIMDRALPWVIVALVAFLAGALITYFAVYQPKVTELTNAQSSLQADLTRATDSVASLQTELDTAKTDLQTAQTDLAAAQTTIEEQTTALAKSEQLVMIYQFQSDVNAALASLVDHQPNSAVQSLNYASTGLTELMKTDLDQNSLAGFQQKIEEANSNLVATPETAITTLILLQSDIRNMISHME